jgi:hypothetical protein
MTPEEFQTWFAHHQAAFPGVAAWFKKIPAEIRPDTIGLWRLTLQRLELDAALKATDTMLADSDRPRFYEEHPAAMLLRAKRDKLPATFKHRIFIDGEETYSCLECKDSGVVICWHSVAIRYFRDHGTFAGCGVRTCAKACTCATGDEYARAYGRFSAKQWLPFIRESDTESFAKLRDFIENSKDTRRERAFDEYAR